MKTGLAAALAAGCLLLGMGVGYAAKEKSPGMDLMRAAMQVSMNAFSARRASSCAVRGWVAGCMRGAVRTRAALRR